MIKTGLVRSDSRRSNSVCGTPILRTPPVNPSLKSPFQTPQSVASSTASRVTTPRSSSLVSVASPGCFVAIVEGRGSARGEIGLASISLSCPTLILCQFSDTRTYTRTLAKLALFNPSDILVKQRFVNLF